MIGAGACMAAGIGAVPAVGVTTATVAGVHAGLSGLASSVRLVIP